MARLGFRVRSTSALARKRAHRLRIEILEDRLAPALAIGLVTTFPGALHTPYVAPVLDSSGNIYTTILNSTTEAASVIKSVGDYNTTIATSFTLGTAVDDGGGGSRLNNGLVVDSSGDVLGTATGISYPTENVFEVPAGQTDWQPVNADILSGISSTGIYTGDFLEGLAVSNGNLYGLTVGTTGVNGPGNTTTALAVVWQYSLAGGNVNVLASWQFPPVGISDSFSADALTLDGNFLYGVTNGTETGSATVFSVPISGGSWNTLANFSSTSYVNPGLAVSGGYVYGTVSSLIATSPTYVFSAPTSGPHEQYPVPLPSTVGSYAGGGLVNDQGTIVGVANGGAAGSGAIFKVDTAIPTNPTPQPVTTFADKNFNETALSGLAVDSRGNAYGFAYDGSALVGIYEVSGLNSSQPPPPPPLAVVIHVGIDKIKTGRKTTKEVIELQFSEGMNTADAQNRASYGLVTVPKSKKQKGAAVALATASYDLSKSTVTLTTRKALVLKQPLKLTVNATSLLDALGRPLDGGVNFVATLSKNGATVTSAVPLDRASRLSGRAVAESV